jgi:hypothetical protein
LGKSGNEASDFADFHFCVGDTGTNGDPILRRTDRPLRKFFDLSQTDHGVRFATMQIDLNHEISSTSEQFRRGMILEYFDKFVNVARD